jgi:hypothetical protein
MEQMRALLIVRDGIPSRAVADYDCSEFGEFQGLMLAKEGFVRHDENVSAWMCKTCDKSLRRNGIPKGAIANGHWYGRIDPRFGDATFVELEMTRLVHGAVVIRRLTGGQGCALKGHTSLMHLDLQQVVQKILPMTKAELAQSYKVVILGPLSSEQRKTESDRNMFRPLKVKELLIWRKQVNHLYRDVIISDDLIQDGSVDLESHIIMQGNEEDEKHDDGMPTTRFNHRHDDVAIHGDVQDVYDVIVGDINQEASAPRKRLVVQTSRSQIKEYDKAMFVMMFPELYIYGRCGLDEKRQVSTSIEYELSKCLRLYDRRFAQNHLFVAVSFNFLRRIKAMEGLFLNVPSELRKDKDFSSMTSENLRVALAWKKDKEKASMRETAHPPLPPADQIGPALKFITRIERANRAVFGSKEEKSSHRADVWGMCYSLGEPHLMFSISPDDLGSLRVHQYIDNSVCDLPDRTERYANIGKDPAACSIWFDRVINILFLDVLGFDAKRGRILRNGVFGPVFGYYAMVETQQSGRLHAHILLWIIGFPRKCSDGRIQLERDAELREQLNMYLKSICCASSQFEPENLPCSECGSKHVINRLEISTSTEQRQQIPDDLKIIGQKINPRLQSEPHLLECNDCHHRNSTTARLVEARLELAKSLLAEGSSCDPILDDIARECNVMAETPNEMNCTKIKIMIGKYISSPPKLASQTRGSSAERFSVGILQSEVLTHHWGHSSTCFKHRSGNVTCRFNFPRMPNKQSGFVNIDGTLLWIPFKGVGSEYLNVHNPLVTKLFRSNNDIRILSCCGSANAVRYCIGYVTKRDSSDSMIDILRFFSRQQTRIEEERKKESPLEHTDQEKQQQGRRILAYILLMSSSQAQIPLTEAILYILNGSMAYHSHKFTPIPLAQIIAFINRQEYIESAFAGEMNSRIRITSWVDRYSHRPDDAENLCPYEYAEQGCSNRSTIQHDTSDDDADNEFPSIKLIPRIIGKRAPDVRSLREGDDNVDSSVDDSREQYGVYCVALFSSFRTPEDVLKHGDTWWKRWLKIRETISGRAREVLENIQNYYISREQKSLTGVISAIPAVGDDICEDECPIVDLDVIDPQSPDISQNEVHDTITRIVDATEGVYVVTLPINPRDISGTFEIKKLKSSVSMALRLEHNQVESVSFLEYKPWPTDSPSRVYWVNRLCCSLDQSKQQELGEIQKYPSIQDVITAFKLNEKQAAAFTLIASLLLRSLYYISRDAVFSLDMEQSTVDRLDELQNKLTSLPEQLIMFLGGVAGTGKSYVLSALCEFARKWKIPELIEVVAPTGMAALNVNGQTIHSALGISISRKSKNDGENDGDILDGMNNQLNGGMMPECGSLMNVQCSENHFLVRCQSR